MASWLPEIEAASEHRTRGAKRLSLADIDLVRSDFHVKGYAAGGNLGNLYRRIQLQDRHVERILPWRDRGRKFATAARPIGENRAGGKLSVRSHKSQLIPVQTVHREVT